MGNIHHYKKEIIEITKNGHRIAEDIYKKIKKNHFFVGIGTIYRNLTELVNEGIIIKQQGLGKNIIYERTKPPHGHLVCEISGSIEDIEISMIDFTKIVLPSNFMISEIKVTIAGHYFTGKNKDSCKISGKIN